MLIRNIIPTIDGFTAFFKYSQKPAFYCLNDCCACKYSVWDEDIIKYVD